MCILSKLYNYILKISLQFDMKNYESEFEDFRTLTNLQRCEKVGIVLLILNILLILVDITVYKPMRAENLSYLYLFYSHIVVFIVVLLWFAFLKLPISCRFKKEKIGYHVLINIVMYWCVFMGLNGINTNGQILAYIICVLALSAFLYITPLEAFITYTTSLVAVDVGLIFIIPNANNLYSYIINVAIGVFFSYIASYVNFKSFTKDFLNKKNILASKMELESANQKLKEYEGLRTDFFANISHELKTPLNVIFSAEQMMEITLNKNGYSDYKINKYLNMVKQNS